MDSAKIHRTQKAHIVPDAILRHIRTKFPDVIAHENFARIHAIQTAQECFVVVPTK